MNIRILLMSAFLLLSPITTHANQKDAQGIKGTIALKDVIIIFDEEQVMAEIVGARKMDKETKITYIISGAAVAIAAITGAVILTVHFNQ